MSATIRQNPIPNAASTDQLSKNKSRITITLEDRIAGLGLLFVLALVYYIRLNGMKAHMRITEHSYWKASALILIFMSKSFRGSFISMPEWLLCLAILLKACTPDLFG